MWLNYHHLHYFWVVAREGSIAKACEILHLSQPTISAQIHTLEKSLGVSLLVRSGRGVALTDVGVSVLRYADEIFTLGRELVDLVQGRPVGQPLRLRVGVVDALAKLVAHRLISPALRLPEKVCVECVEGRLDRLAADLAIHELDVILSDAPLPPGSRTRVFSDLIGTCGVVVLGTPELADRFHLEFPGSLDGAPFLLPTPSSALRRSLDSWFAQHDIHPEIRGEFEDSALLKIFGQAGDGLLAIPAVVELEVQRMYGLRRVGLLEGAEERFYALSVERRLKHPAVVAITEMAKAQLGG